MNYQYQETRSVDDLDEPYPNSVLHTLDPQFVQEILPEDDPEPITAPKPGFWRRQFVGEATSAQRRFDWLFGVVMPVICFYFDPIVFKGASGDRAILGAYSTFAYILSYAAIMCVIATLLWHKRSPDINAAIAGLLGLSGIVSLFIGVVLLPFSLIGLFFYFIGALGFTPFFSGIVFLRNAARANRSAGEVPQ